MTNPTPQPGPGRAQKPPDKVWVLTWNEDYRNQVLSVHATRDSARAAAMVAWKEDWDCGCDPAEFWADDYLLVPNDGHYWVYEEEVR